MTLQRQGQLKAVSESLTLSGKVSGAGGVYKTCAGVLALVNDDNAYASIQGDMGVAAGAHVDLMMQSAKETYTGNIVGLGGPTGSLLKQGEGDLTLTGTSTVAWTVAHGGLISSGPRFSGDVTLSDEATRFELKDDTASVYAEGSRAPGSSLKAARPSCC